MNKVTLRVVSQVGLVSSLKRKGRWRRNTGRWRKWGEGAGNEARQAVEKNMNCSLLGEGTNKLLSGRMPHQYPGHFPSHWFNGYHACLQGMPRRSKASAFLFPPLQLRETSFEVLKNRYQYWLFKILYKKLRWPQDCHQCVERFPEAQSVYWGLPFGLMYI